VPAEAALTLGKIIDCPGEFRFIEIRPVTVGEIQLGVGELP